MSTTTSTTTMVTTTGTPLPPVATTTPAAAAIVATPTATPATGTFLVDLVTVTWLRIANSTEHCFALRQIDETVMRLARTQDDRDSDPENAKVEESVSLRHACSCLAVPLYPATHEEIIELKRASAIGCRAPCASLILGSDLIKVLNTFGRRTFAGIIKEQLGLIGDTTVSPEHSGTLTGRSPSDNPKKKKNDGADDVVTGSRKTPLKRAAVATSGPNSSHPTPTGSNQHSTSTTPSTSTTRARAVPPPQGPTKSKQPPNVMIGDDYDMGMGSGSGVGYSSGKRQRPSTRGTAAAALNNSNHSTAPGSPTGSTIGLLDQPQHQHSAGNVHGNNNNNNNNHQQLTASSLGYNPSHTNNNFHHTSQQSPPKTGTGNNVVLSIAGQIHPQLQHNAHHHHHGANFPFAGQPVQPHHSTTTTNNNSAATSSLLQQQGAQPPTAFSNPILGRTASSGAGLLVQNAFLPGGIINLYDPNPNPSQATAFTSTLTAGNLPVTSLLAQQPKPTLASLNINIGNNNTHNNTHNNNNHTNGNDDTDYSKRARAEIHAATLSNILGTPSNKTQTNSLPPRPDMASNPVPLVSSAHAFNTTQLALPSVLSGVTTLAQNNLNPPPTSSSALATALLNPIASPLKVNPPASTTGFARAGFGIVLQPTLSSYNGSEQPFGATGMIAGAPILNRQPTGVLGQSLTSPSAPLVIAGGPVSIAAGPVNNASQPALNTHPHTQSATTTTALTHTNSQHHSSAVQNQHQALSNTLLTNSGSSLTGALFQGGLAALGRRPQSGFGNMPLGLVGSNANSSGNGSFQYGLGGMTNNNNNNNNANSGSSHTNDSSASNSSLQFSRINSQHNLTLNRINSNTNRTTVTTASSILSRNALGITPGSIALPGNPINPTNPHGTGTGTDNSPTTTSVTNDKPGLVTRLQQPPPTTLTIAPSALPTSFK